MTLLETTVWLTQHDNYYILTHGHPDGDTIGSASALCQALRACGKKACVAPNPDLSERYLPYVDECLTQESPDASHTVVSVDTATAQLLPECYRALPVALSIDHHPTNSHYASLTFVQSDRASTGEIIAEIIEALCLPLTPAMAAPLYVAVSTDTGCFRYSNTTPETFRLAARLMETGIDTVEINRSMFEVKTRTRIGLEAYIFGNLSYYHDGTVAVGLLSRETMDDMGVSLDEVENVSALPCRVLGVDIGVVIREMKNGGSKISVRTTRRYRANRICERVGGGGHDRAAGCQFDGSLTDALNAVLQSVAQEVSA